MTLDDTRAKEIEIGIATETTPETETALERVPEMVLEKEGEGPETETILAIETEVETAPEIETGIEIETETAIAKTDAEVVPETIQRRKVSTKTEKEAEAHLTLMKTTTKKSTI